MSKFYGTIIGATKNPATCRGIKGIKTAAQSYDGSVICKLSYSSDGELLVSIGFAEESDTEAKAERTMTFEKFKEFITA